MRYFIQIVPPAFTSNPRFWEWNPAKNTLRATFRCISSSSGQWIEKESLYGLKALETKAKHGELVECDVVPYGWPDLPEGFK